MPKSAAALSSRLQSRWQRWGVYGSLLCVSVFLLVAEQAGGVRFLWDISKLTTLPGTSVVQTVRATQESVIRWVSWRESVLQRLANSESELLQQEIRQAELTLQLESLSAQAQEASGAGIIDASFWQPAVWEGIPGAWQVRAGCKQGLAVGDPIITPQGILVGSVTAVHTQYSTALSWDTAGWSVPAKVGTTSAVALVRSTVSEPQITGLAWPTPVAIGESVLSAGGGRVPRNLYLGTVAALQPQETFGEVTGTLRPPVQLNRLQHVFVPRGTGDTCLNN